MLVATVMPTSNNGGHRDVTPTHRGEGKISGKSKLILYQGSEDLSPGQLAEREADMATSNALFQKAWDAYLN
jgi:hypothetical protein